MTKLTNISYFTKDTTRAYQALQAFRIGSVILLGVILVKLGFSKEEISSFERVLFLANFAGFFWSMGLNNGLLSFYPDKSDDTKGKLIFNVAVFLLVLSVVASVFIYFLSEKLGIHDKQILRPMLVYIVFTFPSVLSEHFLILKQHSKNLFYYGFITYGSYLLFLGLLVFKNSSISILIHGLAFWAFCRFLYLLYQLIKFQKWSIDTTLIKTFFLFSTPLIIHVLIGNGMEFVDGFLVMHYFDDGDFAVFRYGARELPIVTVLVAALTSTAIPIAVVSMSKSLMDVRQRISRLMNFLFPLSFVFMLISPFVFRHIFSVEYEYSALIFNIYLLVLASRILLPQVAIYAQKKNKILMYVTIIETIINIVLSIVFLKLWGLAGIAMATVVAALFQKTILVIYTKKYLNINMSEYLNLSKYRIYFVLMWLCFLISLKIYWI